MMSDPRLREIEFLAYVERGTTKSLVIPPGSPGEFFGTDSATFRRMVAHLLATGMLNGPDPRAFVPMGPPQPSHALDTIENVKSRDVFCVLMGQPIDLAISHSGLIRLAELREALDRSRTRDPFGLLFDARYWDRDLFVRLLDASEAAPLSLIAVDVDHFKVVNTFGHAIGDEVLRACFQLVLDRVGTRGDAYRRGGDEVTVFLPNTPLNVAATLAETLRAGFAEEFREKLEGVQPTLSIGVSEVVKRAATKNVSDHLDKLAYEAKKAGRNRVVARRFPT